MIITSKQRPILFSTVMVLAQKGGRKTMTRRVMNPHPVKEDKIWEWENVAWINGGHRFLTKELFNRSPYGNPGDILWVREEHYRFGHWEKNGLTKKGKQKWKFVADSDDVRYCDNAPSVYRVSRDLQYPGRPCTYKRLARFMPKDLCRTYLRITDIQVERLQEISEEDAIAEGIEGMEVAEDGELVMKWRDYSSTNGWFYEPRESFRSLWIKINGWESLLANPWVWVVSFERINKPE